MAREFDRFMIDIELSSNPKIARFDDREFRCILTGVWALAAKAKPRGYLLVGKSPATASDVAYQARCSAAVAERTLQKMRELDMLECEDAAGWEHVHDWERINPAPKVDRTNADRQARYRGKHNGVTNGDDNGPRNGGVTPPEVEVEEEVQKNVNTSLSARADDAECFAYWQERCEKPRAKFTAERQKKVRARRREGYTVQDIRRGIDGAAMNPPRDRDSGVTYDDLVSVCRNGAQLERYMERANANVKPFPANGRRESASDLLRAINGGEAS